MVFLWYSRGTLATVAKSCQRGVKFSRPGIELLTVYFQEHRQPNDRDFRLRGVEAEVGGSTVGGGALSREAADERAGGESVEEKARNLAAEPNVARRLSSNGKVTRISDAEGAFGRGFPSVNRANESEFAKTFAFGSNFFKLLLLFFITFGLNEVFGMDSFKIGL